VLGADACKATRGTSMALCFLTNMSELIVASIARRAARPDTRIDMEVSKLILVSALGKADAEASELALGFSVPELLKLVYERVGNGGFGPGYGLIRSIIWRNRRSGSQCSRCV